ncbi:MAG: type II toxin-antitoxin system PemK/MazF family toxin [Chloroflexia bacterium]|nr:type II toxin-antitoxin system PemK/MazF family toxin [Chloroflexia bacterium]
MSSGSRQPLRGEVWQVLFDPVVGREQAGERPAVVVSFDALNSSPAAIAIVVPITRRDRSNPLHVAVLPPEGGLTSLSFVLCESVRSVSTERFRFRRGALTAETMALLEDRLRIVLDLV